MAMPLIGALAPILAPLLGDVVRRILPEDKEKAAQLQHEFSMALFQNAAALEQAAADVVKTEAASKHWLAANWRPMLMIFFAGIIGARMFGWTAPGVSEAEYIELWNIVELGVGGYVIGRTGEKVLPGILGAIRKQ